MTDVMPEQLVDLDEVAGGETTMPASAGLDAVDEQLAGRARAGGLQLAGEGGLLITRRVIVTLLNDVDRPSPPSVGTIDKKLQQPRPYVRPLDRPVPHGLLPDPEGQLGRRDLTVLEFRQRNVDHGVRVRHDEASQFRHDPVGLCARGDGDDVVHQVPVVAVLAAFAQADEVVGEFCEVEPGSDVGGELEATAALEVGHEFVLGADDHTAQVVRHRVEAQALDRRGGTPFATTEYRYPSRTVEDSCRTRARGSARQGHERAPAGRCRHASTAACLLSATISPNRPATTSFGTTSDAVSKHHTTVRTGSVAVRTTTNMDSAIESVTTLSETPGPRSSGFQRASPVGLLRTITAIRSAGVGSARRSEPSARLTTDLE